MAVKADKALQIINAIDRGVCQRVHWNSGEGQMAAIRLAERRRAFFLAFIRAGKLAALPGADEKWYIMSLMPRDILIMIVHMARWYPA